MQIHTQQIVFKKNTNNPMILKNDENLMTFNELRISGAQIDAASDSILHIPNRSTQDVTQEPNNRTSDAVLPFPKAWILDLGNFSDIQYVLNLIQQIEEMNLDVYYDQKRQKLTGLLETHLYIGPYIDEPYVRLIQKKIHDEFRLPTQILVYQPKKQRHTPND